MNDSTGDSARLIEEYRFEAERCEAYARSAADAEDALIWHDLARRWRTMAVAIEQAAAKQSRADAISRTLLFTHLIFGDTRISDRDGRIYANLAEVRAAAKCTVRRVVATWLESGEPLRLDVVVEITDSNGRVFDILSADYLLFETHVGNRLGKVALNSRHSYLLLRPDFVILDANHAFLKSTMTDLPTITGQEIFRMFPDNPGDPNAIGKTALAASFHDALLTKTTRSVHKLRYDIRARDGTWQERYWTSFNFPILDDNGEVEFLVSNVEDVTRDVPN
ncbi:PAS domain-containing protein [Variibacter gotjawalensis]|nr:PAS domain-containing protein [Variibacter gotjawalensis]NIK49838.1 PAS domain-containing protein [Variibacter gotjawalensis]